MRRLLIAYVAAALITALLAPAVGAEGKITADPNAPGAKPADTPVAAAQEEDAAFSKRITYDGSDLDLTTILSQVSELSGVKMQPSSTKDNWQVRQRTAIVFVNDSPLSEFKNGLAKLFSYRWTKVTADDGTRSYVLRELVSRKTARRDMMDAERQAQMDANRASIKAAVDTAERATKLTPEELKDARENDPWLYYLAANPSGRMWAEVIRTVPPDWWEQAAQGKERRVDVAAATDPVELKIIGLLDQIRELPPSGTSGYGNNTSSLSTYRSDPLDQFILNAGMLLFFVRHTTSSDDGKGISWTGQQIELCPVGPSDSSGCMVAGTQSILAEDGKPLEEVRQAALDTVCDYFNAKNKDPEPDSTTDPALLKEIEHKPLADLEKKDEPSLATHLRGLARETGFTIMAETFDNDRNVSPKDVWAPDKGTIFQILSDLTTTGRMTWEKSGNAILFRYKEWPKLRSLEVSNDLVKRWENLAKAKGYLSFGDLYDIVQNATNEQIEVTLAKNQLLKLAGLDHLIHGPYFAFLVAAAVLPEDQGRALLSETGVPAKLLKQIDFSSDPKAQPMQGWIDSAATKGDDAVLGICEVPNQSCPKQVRFFTRSGDGKTTSLDWTIASQEDIKAVRDYVKSLETPAPTPNPHPLEGTFPAAD